jgi:hypothetical protein
MNAESKNPHALLHEILAKYCKYDQSQGNFREQAASMATQIANENGNLLDMLGETHYDQAKRLGDHPDPCEDMVQKGIMTAKRNNEVVTEILFYLTCKDDNEYASLNKFAHEQEKAFMEGQKQA